MGPWNIWGLTLKILKNLLPEYANTYLVSLLIVIKLTTSKILKALVRQPGNSYPPFIKLIGIAYT